MRELPFLPYARQCIEDIDIESVTACMKQDLITRGPNVAAFEKMIQERCHVKHAVFFSTGSGALEAAYRAIEIRREDRIVTTPITYIASLGAGQRSVHTRSILCDLGPCGANMDIEKIPDILSRKASRGKIVLCPVHMSGVAIDMRRLSQMIHTPDLRIIEDCAHAIGSYYPSGEPVGSCAYSDISIFSFHPAKTICSAEGGMCTTNSDAHAAFLRTFRNNGVVLQPENGPQSGPWTYDVQLLSGNYNVSELHASLAVSQLKRLDLFVQKRRHLVTTYRKLLKNLEGIEPVFDESVDARTAFHLMIVQIDFTRFHLSRADLMKKLASMGIGTQVHYIPLYQHSALLGQLETTSDQCPYAEKYYSRALSLPLYYQLEEKDVARVVESLAICTEQRCCRH